MQITRLVIRFNYRKLIAGLLIAFFLFYIAHISSNQTIEITSSILGVFIILNIIAAIIASYILYDKSDIFKLNKLPQEYQLDKFQHGILIHASFDPVSKKIESQYPDLKLTVCDIYGNRHEHESGIKDSKKVFPAHDKEIKIDPTKLPFENNSTEVIIAISALHEILSQKKRIIFFKEAKRILKENGIIIVSEQFRNSTNFLFFNIGVFHFVSQNNWRKAIGIAGLKIVQNNKITPFANQLIIKKNTVHNKAYNQSS